MAEFLYAEFCNHIYLGQWELARACAFNLIKSDACSDEIKRKLISTIQSLSKDPYLASSAWSSLPCPSYVNLLSCCLLSDLCCKDGEECKDYIDFNILLEMTLGSPESILKELTCIFDEVTKIKRSLSTNSYPNFEITNECVTALKNSFKENPSQVSLLLKKLCLPEQMKFSLNTVFCNMFVQLILNCLKSAESSFTKKENATFMKNLVHKIYLLLSLLPDFITDKDRDAEQIFLYCIELAESSVLKLDKIYSSLLGCSTSRLLKYFCKLEDNISGNKESNVVKFKVLKSNYITAEGNFHHRKALLWSLCNSSHFLHSIMECYVENILNGNWESIKGEICDLPSQLKSLFLLLSWEKCTDDTSSMNVIKAMKMWNESVEDPVIQAACKKFQLNISLSEMCISNYKSLFPLSESVEIQNQLWRILTSLQTQSLLRVLHTVCGLKNIPCVRLENMLKQSQEHFCNADLNLSTVLTDESIYCGYIIMVSIMEAIYLSCEFKDALESKQISLSTILYKIVTKSSDEKSDTTDECKTSEVVSLSTYMSKHGCQEAYSKFIVEKLEAARQKIKNLLPLSFRVEILENIFSMLFLMVKNLVDLTEPSYDSDQGHEEESQLFDKDDSFSTYSVEVSEMKFMNRFIISTTKLKNSIMLKNGASENVSGHISSKSTESTGSNGYQPHTFLCNELITRDMLSLLKDSVLEAKAEIYKKIGWHDPNQMEDTSTKKTSFQSESKLSDNYNGLPERTSRLLQYVNEAIWRHEVVQRDIFQKRISLIDRHRNKPHFLQSQCSTSSSEGTDKEIKKHRKRKKHKYSSSQKDESIAESSIIQCMLSSPEALLRYSLWNGNFMQAGQVIKLFNLQTSDEAKELTLINELQQISNKLLAYDKIKGKSVKKSTSLTDEKSISSSVSTIKSAVSYGLHSSSLYMTIHQELSSLRVLQVMDISGQVHHPELLLGSENIYSIFLIDLACVSNTSIELASSLLDSADKSWTSVSTGCKDFETKTQLQKKIPLIKGNSQVLHMMNSLLKEFLCFFKENPIQSDIYSIFWPIKKDFQTVPQVLPYFIGNLNHKQFKEEINNWKNMCFLIEEFSTLLDTEERSEQTGTSVKDIKQENKLHMTYKQLSRTLRGLRDWSCVVISSEVINYSDYLSKLFIHLRQVTTAALECKNQNFSAGQTIYSSDFSILKESPVELLKKIILQTGITPEKIENFAIRMKVDLVRVLAQACLPYVPLLKGSISLDKLFRPACQIQTEGYPKYILNMSRRDWPNPRHPDLVARELLRDLISMLQETAIANDSNGIFKTEELISVTQHSQLSSWMEECSELAFVDLDLLQTREEKLAFFINVTNVAWLYAILLQTVLGKSQEKEEEENKSPDCTESNNDGKTDYSQELLLSSNNLERFTVQKLMGFSVGQLGAISLFDLRYQLLRDQLPVPKHLDASPFHKLFCDKNPIWNNYMPILEPRLLFVLVEGLLFSPKLQVIYSEDIDDTLEKAMKDYFDFTIHIDVENDSVTLPQLLEWYALDFSKEDENCFDKAPYEGLINLLSTLVRPPLTQSFQELLSEDSAYNFSENIDSSGKKQLPFTLEFRKAPVYLGIMLEYCSLSEIQPNMKTTSLMDPQPIIINYLKEKCSILTDLYEIIISENPSQNLLESNHTVPVFNLLQYYHDINVLSNEKFVWFSSALSPSPNRKYFMEQIEFCFSANMWHQSLQFIDIYLEYHGKPEYNLDFARQMILEHISSLNPSTSASEPSNYALCISDPLCRANAVLQNVHKWTEHSALKALKYCLSDSKISDFPDVYLALKTKFKEITLYKKHFCKVYISLSNIYQSSLNIGSGITIVDASEIYGNSEAKDCVYVFNNWQEVADCSVWDQSRIFDFLNSCEKYDLAVEWLELNVVNSQEKINALSMNLLWYLLQDPPDERALKILDTLENSECLKLCDIVLPKLSSVDAKLCLVKYLVNNVPAENQQYYYNMFLGLKMLAALKSPVKETYAELVGHPYLILEQMLMNVELKDAEKALNAVIQDLESLSDIVPVMNKASVNQLVEDYASKALEVHFLDALLDTSSSSTLVLSIEDSMVSDEPFVMPVRVPTKEEWVPDAKIHRCQVCKEERFNMFTRRHHCRRCGRVVCANCSQHALIVEGYGNVKVRVCEECYNLMTGSISVTSSSFDKRYRVLSSMQSSPRNSPFQENIGPRRRTSSIHQAYRWVLSPDNEQNASVRNEFAYEQAPSISLCFSILKLHCECKKCAQCMLNLCDRLLGKIKPRRSGKIPVEIDYNLIISMIKSLLMSVKVTCHQIMDNEREALADLYFQHLDFVKLLVNANCRHLLPREALTNTDSVRKLRDKLLEEERLSLALEVSTKFHLDKTGVWSSWGLFCIRAGDLPAARTKFQQCLKVISDKNDPKQESPLLNKILEVLENSKHAGNEKASAIYKSLSYLKNIEKGTNWLKTESSTMDEMIQKECEYYLSTYGTHFTTVRFYQRNSLTYEALNYIVNKKCEPEIFIEAIFMPMLKNVQLSSLKHNLSTIDPSLSAWWNYLFATCRHLERLKYLNVLYEMQLFMEDYARAAKSAINFYLAPASTYKMLFERHRFLYNAKKHYQKYLRDSKETDSFSLSQKNKNLKILSPKEVERYIEIIILQEEVSRFFQQCISQSNQGSFYEIPAENNIAARYYPPTLFGNLQKRTQVTMMVILNAVNIDEGFELAIKIIQIFGLDATAILCEAGKELVKISQKVQIPHFLACVKCFFSDMVRVDQVILECISEIHKQRGEVEDIIKMLTSDTNKINAYLMCDKLKSAYLLAIKLKSALDVRRVLVTAEQSGQAAIQQICKKWLESNSESKLK